eukprot:GDKK01060073.1.p1 GENE.GDKK01060073.1~~GDKK01060073.1.p1  ORF type:complete len:436 (+),score=96.59 GDKK01060073.1:41-1309(+)
MSSTHAAFVAEVLNQKFWEKYFEKEPHVFTNEEFPSGPKLISDLISYDEYANMILQAGPRIKYFKNHLPVDLKFPPYIAYLEGCSIIMNQSDRLNRQIYELCRALRPQLHHVFAVTYLTPAKSSTVPVHNDDQDTFLWQVWGEKEWTVYGPAPQALIYTNEMLGKGDNGVPEMIPPHLRPPIVFKKTLKPGELMYLPRGWLHSATTSDKPSLHVTLTTASSDYNYGANLERVIKECIQPFHAKLFLNSGKEKILNEEEDMAVRSAIPTADQSETLKEELKKKRETVAQALEKVKSLLNVDALEQTFNEHMRTVNEGQDEFMASERAKRQFVFPISSSSRVKLIDGVQLEVEKDKKSAIFKNKTKGVLKLPIDPRVAGVFEMLSDGKQYTVSQLNKAANKTDDILETMCVLFVIFEKDVLSIK